MPTTILREVVQSPNAKVNRDLGQIEDVRVLGATSLNDGSENSLIGRKYLPEAIRSGVKKYHGKVVNANHPLRDTPGADRSVYDRFGWLDNVREKDGGIVATLNFLKSHPMAESICEAAERNPALFGLSHNAEGRTRRENGTTLVEEITRVKSVDVVSDPASTRSLFESQENDIMAKTVRELLETLPKKSKQYKVLREVVEDELVPGDLPIEEPPIEKPPVEAPPAGEEESADVDTQVKTALATAAKAAIDDEKLDAKATGKKVTEILVAAEKLTNGGESSESSEPSEPSKEETKESRQVNARLEQMQEQLTAIKGLVGKEQPQGGMPLTESRRSGNGEKAAANAKEFRDRVFA